MYCPAKHSVQLWAIFVAEICPLGQSMQPTSPLCENLPGAQIRQNVVPRWFWFLPAGQSWHAVALVSVLPRYNELRQYNLRELVGAFHRAAYGGDAATAAVETTSGGGYP